MVDFNTDPSLRGCYPFNVDLSVMGATHITHTVGVNKKFYAPSSLNKCLTERECRFRFDYNSVRMETKLKWNKDKTLLRRSQTVLLQMEYLVLCLANERRSMEFQ